MSMYGTDPEDTAQALDSDGHEDAATLMREMAARITDLETQVAAVPALAKQDAGELRADWSRYRGSVLQDAWEALRDAKGGPLIYAMNVVTGLLEQAITTERTSRP